MRGLTLFAFLVTALLVIGLASSTLTNSVSGLSTKYSTSPPVASKMSLKTQRVGLIYNTANLNPFEEIHKLNFSNTLTSMVKHMSKANPEINSIKVNIKSDINNHFRLPMDIPFP